MDNESDRNGCPWEENGPRIMKSIPISEFDDTDKRFQFRFPSSRTKLGKSLAERGQLNPIKTMPGDGAYVIIDGFSRYAEAKRQGWKEIKALIYSSLSDKDAKKISWECNIERANLSTPEKANAMLVARKDGLTLKEVASLFRKSVRQVSRYLELPEKLRGLIDGTILTMAHARALKGHLDQLTHADLEQLAEWAQRTHASSKALNAKVKREFGGDTRGKQRTFGNVQKGCVRFYSTKLVSGSHALDRAAARAFLVSAIRELDTWDRSDESESG